MLWKDTNVFLEYLGTYALIHTHQDETYVDIKFPWL